MRSFSALGRVRNSVQARAVTSGENDMTAVPATGTTTRKLRTLSKKNAAAAKAPLGSGDAPVSPVADPQSGMSSADAEEAERKKSALQASITRLSKQFGPNTLMAMDGSREVVKNIDRISTGCLTVDGVLGGGIPRGRIIEVFGPESSGKTTLALSIMAQALKQYPTDAVLLIDVEHAYDKAYGNKLGLQSSRFYYSQPDSGDEALATVEEVIRSGSVSIVVVDSVAALLPASEITREAGDPQIGAQAKLMSNHLKRIAASAAKYNVAVLFINQLRMKIGVMFGNPETTSGGMALLYYASQRIDVRRKEVIQGDVKEGPARGIKIRAKVVKNKVAAPHGQAIFDLYFDSGLDRTASMIDGAVQFGVLDKRGAFYYLTEDVTDDADALDKSFAQGRDAMKELLEKEENADLWQRIYDVTLAKMTNSETTVSFDDENPTSPLAGMQTGA